MASTASLQTKRRYSPVRHYILWMIRRYLWVALLAGALYTILTVGLTDYTPWDEGMFRLFNAESLVPLRWTVVLFGIFSAFLLFGYLWNRRETTCYGALGIGRSKQFWIRYLIGFTCNLLPLIVPLIICYALNIRQISADPHGVCKHYTVVFILALCLVSWLSYTVSVIVALMCGRMTSAGLCAAGVLAAPYAVMLAAQSLMNTYLLGAPGGSLVYANDIPWLNFMENVGRRPGLLTMLESSTERIGLYETLLVQQEWVDLYMAERPLPAVKFLLLAGLALALAISAWWLFCRRKAEHAGQLYIHPILN